MQPGDPISKHFRLTPAQIRALRKLGLSTIKDLLYHFPARYEPGGAETHTGRLAPGEKVTLFGKISGLKAKKLWKSRRPATEGWFEDAGGRVKLLWFNQPYIASYIAEGSFVRLAGTVGGSAGRFYIASPEVEIVPSGSVQQKEIPTLWSGPRPRFTGVGAKNSVIPVYPESRGITSLWFYHAVKRAFGNGAHKEIADPIPASVRTKYHLPELSTALVWIHTPEKSEHAEAARKRFSFEEIFVIQVARAKERLKNASEAAFPIRDAETYVGKFLSSIDFPPTAAQKKSIANIIADFQTPHPMARLLEGDVGSGKTLVAAATAYAVVTNRRTFPRESASDPRSSASLQVAYMAPTEILAAQHFQSFIEYFRDLPINIGLITGSGCKKFPSKSARGKATDISRSQLLKWVANGEIAMLIGTHALIQKTVRFQNLAYVIVDEQHRFGTAQRRALAKKSALLALPAGRQAARQASSPHFLSMTATPIPRTLALTLYGDLDISILDELPPGRAKVTTKIVKPEERREAEEAVRRELKRGRQAFVVCPRIDEPDPEKFNALQAKSAKAEAVRLKKDVFPEFEIGLLHGKVLPKEKDDIMRRFAAGEIDILVATSVVEVGINVPNATVMMIEGAERFGLAQLHQLRGRIQRSTHAPYCFLLPESSGEAARKRLQALEKSDDGFKLAEADLEARGAGDLFGRRQWGITDIGMEALRNPRLIQAARTEAIALVKNDPMLLASPALAGRASAVSGELHVE